MILRFPCGGTDRFNGLFDGLFTSEIGAIDFEVR